MHCKEVRARSTDVRRPCSVSHISRPGLLTIYSINIVLAVVAVFRAGERGQPKGLWVAKTMSVGGLALDQLTQLPTLEQTEQAKNRKGARALKKNCK